MMPRILPESVSQVLQTVHSSTFCSWRGGGPLGARQQLVCRLHRRVGSWADGWLCHPAPSHPPSQVGPGKIDRVTVEDYISTRARDDVEDCGGGDRANNGSRALAR